MKKFLILGLCGIISFNLIGCSKSDSTSDNNSSIKSCDSSTSTSKNNSTTIKDINLGDFVSVSTENGNFNIAFYGAKETEWDKTGYEDDLQDDNEDTYPASIRVAIENIDYSGLYENNLCGYDLDSEGIISVKDSEGYSLDYFDISGPTDGEYTASEEIPVGEKKKVSLPYTVPNDESSLTVIINKQYSIKLDVERLN